MRNLGFYAKATYEVLFYNFTTWRLSECSGFYIQQYTQLTSVVEAFKVKFHLLDHHLLDNGMKKLL